MGAIGPLRPPAAALAGCCAAAVSLPCRVSSKTVSLHDCISPCSSSSGGGSYVSQRTCVLTPVGILSTLTSPSPRPELCGVLHNQTSRAAPHLLRCLQKVGLLMSTVHTCAPQNIASFTADWSSGDVSNHEGRANRTTYPNGPELDRLGTIMVSNLETERSQQWDGDLGAGNRRAIEPQHSVASVRPQAEFVQNNCRQLPGESHSAH